MNYWCSGPDVSKEVLLWAVASADVCNPFVFFCQIVVETAPPVTIKHTTKPPSTIPPTTSSPSTPPPTPLPTGDFVCTAQGDPHFQTFNGEIIDELEPGTYNMFSNDQAVVKVLGSLDELFFMSSL